MVGPLTNLDLNLKIKDIKRLKLRQLRRIHDRKKKYFRWHSHLK